MCRAGESVILKACGFISDLPTVPSFACRVACYSFPSASAQTLSIVFATQEEALK